MQEYFAEVSLPIRELVEFVLASGSIDNRYGGGDLYQRANEGSRLHRKLQRQSKTEYGDRYHSEVALSDDRVENGILYHIFGRADAILTDSEGTIIEEIKTTELPLSSLSGDPSSDGYRPLHWAQAKCYAFILSQKEKLSSVRVRLIYCQVETEETISFTQNFSALELQTFYTGLLQAYRRWAVMRFEWTQIRDKSAKELPFPFESYRAGQRQMAAVIYRAAAAGSRVLCQAPTGIGKTISSLFPSVKAMGEGLVSHLFYLTAKTSTRAIAEEGFSLMQQKGLRLKRVTLTAKDKICFLPERLCNPDDCPYAKDYFDRIQDVLFEMLEKEDSFTRQTIEHWAKEKTLCPFELGLDLSSWCDAIICDYNYLFDPVVYLKRFFDHRDRYAFLIDEAHNLLDRARGMYSAMLQKSDVLTCKKLADPLFKPLSKSLNTLNREMLSLKKQILAQEDNSEHALSFPSIPKPFWKAAQSTLSCCSQFLEERRQSRKYTLFQVEENIPQEILQFYFDLRFFLRIAELADTEELQHNFCFFVSTKGSQVTVKLLCLDPAPMIDNRMKLGQTTALFSATLSPPSYYKTVLGCDHPQEKTNSYSFPSPFSQENLCLLVCGQINTRWAAREESLVPIARLIHQMVSAKKGNYLAYFPSYQYLEKEAEVFSKLYPDIRLICQSPQMDDQERADFLQQFDYPDSSPALLGFAVLGGIYSEGVDLKGEKLLGTAIIGTGLPKVGTEQEILRDYYQQKNHQGYDFAYRYPGMNKVLQAAGRVIRGQNDRGVVLLLDDRFSTPAYLRLFPEHWHHAHIVYDSDGLSKILHDFWSESSDQSTK